MCSYVRLIATTSQICPRLVIKTKNGSSAVSGPKDIKGELKAINKAIRESNVSPKLWFLSSSNSSMFCSKNHVVPNNRIVIISEAKMIRMEANGEVTCGGKIVHSPGAEYIFEVKNAKSGIDKKAIKLQSVLYPHLYLTISSDQVMGTVSRGILCQSDPFMSCCCDIRNQKVRTVIFFITL